MADKLSKKPMIKAISKKPAKKKPPAPVVFNTFASAAAAAGYIAVFIDPVDGAIVVPFSTEINTKDAKNFIPNKHNPVVQFARYQYNPTCIWYVDQNGQLRQRCI